MNFYTVALEPHLIVHYEAYWNSILNDTEGQNSFFADFYVIGVKTRWYSVKVISDRISYRAHTSTYCSYINKQRYSYTCNCNMQVFFIICCLKLCFSF